jgi:hypothetical protein
VALSDNYKSMSLYRRPISNWEGEVWKCVTLEGETVYEVFKDGFITRFRESRRALIYAMRKKN